MRKKKKKKKQNVTVTGGAPCPVLETSISFPGWVEKVQLLLTATPLAESGDSTEGYGLRVYL